MTAGAVVPTLAASSCPGWQAINPVCQIGGVVSGVAGAGVGAVFDGLSHWVAGGASWLIGETGKVLGATTAIDVRSPWFVTHYQQMMAVAAAVMMPLFLAATVQAVLRQSAGPLIRAALVHLPLALLLTAAATELVQLGLRVTDALSRAVSSGSGTSVDRALTHVSTALGVASGNPALPPFVVLLGALLLAAGAFVLWLELLVRSAAVYVAVLFLPLALASVVWPATAHWCRRLVDTLAALVLSKFVVVAILSLAVGAVAAGSSPRAGFAGFAAVLSGGAILLLAAYSPFTLLKLVPMVEAGAVHHLETARHRMAGVVAGPPRTAATWALRHAGAAALDAGAPGTGLASTYEAPGGSSVGAGGPGSGRGPLALGAPAPGGEAAPVGGAAAAVPMWQGDVAADRAFWQALTGQGAAPAAGEVPRRSPEAAAVEAGRAGDDGRPDRGAVRPAWRDPHVVGRDALGPVIRWIPPPSDTEPEAGRPPEGRGD